MNAFLNGFLYAFRGIKEFYCHPRLWLYAVIPFICVKCFFVGISWILMEYWVHPAIARGSEWVSSLGSEKLTQAAEWGLTTLYGLVMLMVFASLASTLFEMFGAIFFSRMVRRYEKDFYHRLPADNLTLAKDLKNTLDCIFYSIGTLLITVLILVLGFFLPLVSQVLAILVVGYRFGVSYGSEAGFNRGMSLAGFKAMLANDNKLLMRGFGCAVFCLLMIPFVSILLIPGFVIGGTLLVNDKLALDAADSRDIG